MDKYTAIIPAAGQGKRMQGDRNKQFMLLGGIPIIVHTLRVFQESPVIHDVIIVCGREEVDYYRAQLIPDYGIKKSVRVVTGGEQRQDSVYRGLVSAPSESRYVMIHDGARPLITQELINSLAKEVIDHGAVVPGVPVKDTIKKTDNSGFIIDTPPRENLWHVQTPQVFDRELIFRAHKEALKTRFYGTDDASLVERLGVPVKIISGSYENLKITTPDDLIAAEAIIRRRADS